MIPLTCESPTSTRPRIQLGRARWAGQALVVALATVLAGLSLAGLPSFAAAGLPDGWTTTGALREAGGWLVAQGEATITAPLPGRATVRLELRLGGLKRPASCRLEAGDRALDLLLEAQDAEYRVGLIGDEVIPLPDACVDVKLGLAGGESLLAGRYFVRPHPHWYEGEDRRRLLARWASLPGAAEHSLALRIDAGERGAGVWLDDRFLGRAELPGARTLRLSLPDGGALRGVTVDPAARLQTPARPAGRAAGAEDAYVRIGLGGYRRPGFPEIDRVSLPGASAPGEATLDGVSFQVDRACVEKIDVGVSRWLAEATGPEEFTDNYYTRSALDSRPEDILLAVPTDDYAYAHVLCFVDPDPGKAPVLTLRLTRYLEDYYDSGGRGAAIADSSIRLQKVNGRWPDGCREAGKVRLRGAKDGGTLSLLQVAIPLRTGLIQDVLEEKGTFCGRSTQHLDLELTKELHVVKKANHGAHSTKPVGPPSAVRVLALTLERAPVKARVSARRVGHVFVAPERPGVDLHLENRTAGPFRGVLRWRTTDYYGAVRQGSQRVALPTGQEGTTLPLDLQPRVYGWHRLELALRDAAGRLIWEHPTSFAYLPPDTRRAGQESPFGIWWFRDSHVGTASTAEMAPLLQRLGVRHVSPGGSGPDGDELAKQGLSISMLPDFVRSGEAGRKALDDAVARHPGAGWALIFHECGFGEGLPYPPEFLGKEPPKLTPEQERQFLQWYDKAVAYSAYCRDKHPGVKLIVGNSSLPFAVEFMRRGYPREYVDAFGDEDLGQSVLPEAPPGAYKSVYWLREYAKRYGYNVPVTSCYEWRGRGTNPGCLSELEQAQLYVRDILQGLAYRMPHINPGLLHDVGDAYYYSRWGSGGVCHRYPLLNPKISYVAVATLTRELDGATFRRFLDTGSPTLHAMEFARNGAWIYALWLPRGQREVTLTFGRDPVAAITDVNGNSRAVKASGGRVVVTVSASPCYLTSDGPIRAVAAGPTTCEAPPARRTVVDALSDLGDWSVVREPDAELERCHFDFPRHLAQADVQSVRDGERGRALQITLQPQPDVPWPVSRYVVLKARKGIVVPGRPTSVGLWVKGNSCWGRVFWELEDARGERFLSIGAPCDGWSVGDWLSRTFINFDGWSYLSLALPFRYASGFYGPPEHNWTHSAEGVVDHPIRFTRLAVELRDKVVHLTEAIDVPDKSIRVKDLTVSYR